MREGACIGGATTLQLLMFKVDPQCCGFDRREPDFALQGLIEHRAAIPEQVRVVALRWQSSGREVQSSGREVRPQSSGREVRPLSAPRSPGGKAWK